MQGGNTHPIPPPACGGRGFSPQTLQWVSHKGSLHIDHCVAPKTHNYGNEKDPFYLRDS